MARRTLFASLYALAHAARRKPFFLCFLVCCACGFAIGHNRPNSANVIIPRRHAPRIAVNSAPVRALGDVKVFESNNWSGYALVGSKFTEARGSWIVPSVDCSVVPNASVSFWVGIDGWTNSTVEQTGTDSDCNGGQPSYYAWYEFAPKGGVTITSVPVSPGDVISGKVVYEDSVFVVTLTNDTTGESYSIDASVPAAQRASAEWITELNGYNLSNFDTVRFGKDFTDADRSNWAVDETTAGTIGDFGKRVQASVIVAGKKKDLAVPSFLSADGTSFTVTWWRK
jgi:hypothetical protein